MKGEMMGKHRFVFVVIKASEELPGQGGWPLIAFENEASAHRYIDITSETSKSFGIDPGTFIVQALRLSDGTNGDIHA